MSDRASADRGGVLSGPDIWRLVHRKADPLVVMPPLFKRQELIEANSIDLRLGHEIILMRKSELGTLKFVGDLDKTLARFYDPTYLGWADEFMLHPGELVLGATLEYLVLPKDVMAYIIGRSSWGRLGLIIATATVIHPGYKGCPTLELVNHGNIPIELFPGGPIPVAQICLHWVGRGQGMYRGRYAERWIGSTGPGFSRIHRGKVLEKWVLYRQERERG